jgi:CheY-specific phosphatase CheX
MPEIASSLVMITEDAVREALEQMFFLVVLGRREAAGMPTAEAVAAELAFTGEACGVFRLALSRQTAAEATANFLGEDPDNITGEQINAVVCEMANIICGSALSRWRDEGLFSLNSPAIVQADEEWLPNAEACPFDMENGTLTFSVAIDEDGDEGCLA